MLRVTSNRWLNFGVEEKEKNHNPTHISHKRELVYTSMSWRDASDMSEDITVITSPFSPHGASVLLLRPKLSEYGKAECMLGS